MVLVNWRIPHPIRRHILGPIQLNFADGIEHLSTRVDILKKLIPVEYINTLNQQSKENDVFMMLITELHQLSPRYITKLLRLAMYLVPLLSFSLISPRKVRAPTLKEEARKSE